MTDFANASQDERRKNGFVVESTNWTNASSAANGHFTIVDIGCDGVAYVTVAAVETLRIHLSGSDDWNAIVSGLWKARRCETGKRRNFDGFRKENGLFYLDGRNGNAAGRGFQKAAINVVGFSFDIGESDYSTVAYG